MKISQFKCALVNGETKLQQVWTVTAALPPLLSLSSTGQVVMAQEEGDLWNSVANHYANIWSLMAPTVDRLSMATSFILELNISWSPPYSTQKYLAITARTKS